MNKKIAIVRIRGSIGMNEKVLDTLQLLRLNRKNSCVIVQDNPSMLGMIQKVKDYVTYGEIDEETYKLLIEKKGKKSVYRETDNHKKIEYKRYIVINDKKYSPVFALNPPKKGFGRKGIKINFKIGGALGDRKEKINDLIKRMV